MVVLNRCGDCVNVTPVTRFHTLDIHGNPTLGECPYWTDGRCTILSWMSECEHYKRRVEVYEEKGK